MILEYNTAVAYDVTATYSGTLDLRYDSFFDYNTSATYDGSFETIIASNFQPTFTGPPRDSGGITRTSLILGYRRNKEEEELLSLLGYL
jgi:hypothetical protein